MREFVDGNRVFVVDEKSVNNGMVALYEKVTNPKKRKKQRGARTMLNFIGRERVEVVQEKLPSDIILGGGGNPGSSNPRPGKKRERPYKRRAVNRGFFNNGRR